MRRMRRHGSGGLIALVVACLLLVQALCDSVGLGMSGGMPAMAMPGMADMPGMATMADMPGMAMADHAPAAGGHKAPAKTPFCPFCFVAAQIALHPATPPAPPGLAIRPQVDGYAAWTWVGHPDAPRRLLPSGGQGPRAPPIIGA